MGRRGDTWSHDHFWIPGEKEHRHRLRLANPLQSQLFSYFFYLCFLQHVTGVHRVREHLAQHFPGDEGVSHFAFDRTTKTSWQALAACSFGQQEMDGWCNTSRFGLAKVRGRGQEWDVRAQLLRQYQTID